MKNLIERTGYRILPGVKKCVGLKFREGLKDVYYQEV